ncbi:MAG: D-aminoacylase [Bacteroidetes bacterium]|nr:D-aminoacylase [Rhodothermia bacterium]MCS7156023.1 D-aminoacylase [Bacteroidota bacterium]MCX7907711.1 D-aminoacylase [Bacteroidota bacterium]MDW8137840.1 D-aminoacylase [Bacteroidota bacterium]MDW8286309.1 D-aminoacylase [Bacteroidota bacterium]
MWLLALALLGQGADTLDLLLRNGRIVDGTGNPWFYGDVGIRGGKIAAIGNLAHLHARTVLDVQGQVIAPGFIDTHAHLEGSILELPTADNFVRMGITTAITGNCGGSAADIERFFRQLDSVRTSIHVASLIGHNTVRRLVMGEAARPPSAEELERMRVLVARGMRAGALGFSTGLIYTPGTFAQTDEVVALARQCAHLGGLYVSHIRDEGNQVEAAIQEAIEVGRQAGCPVQISHFKIASKRKWGDSRHTVALVAQARSEGLAVTVDQYVYPASSTGIEVLIPTWVFDGGRDSALKRLQNPTLRRRIIAEMLRSLRAQGFRDFSHAQVAYYGPDTTLNGLRISEITRRLRGRSSPRDQAEQVLDMYAASPRRVGMVYHKMSEQDVRYILTQPFTMIGADAGIIRYGVGVPHPRGYGNAARVLARYVRQEGIISLEEAVRKMTSLPAQTFGLWDRGLIRPGMVADIVVFDPDRIQDRATFERPHQYPEGIQYVIVNGVLVVKEGQHTGARPAGALRRPSAVGPELGTR